MSNEKKVINDDIFFTKTVSICKNLTDISIGYFYGRGIVSFNSLSDVFTNIIKITSNMDNVCDVLLLTAEKTGTTGSGNVFASISWQEIY